MDVKDELSRLVVGSRSARRAEVAALLRFAGQLRIVSGRVVVEAAVDSGRIAARLRKDIVGLYGHGATVGVLSAGRPREDARRYVLRVVTGAEVLARQTGLLDRWGRPVCGLPAWVIAGSGADAAAAWRGAFLACGSLAAPGRSPVLSIDCPGVEAAQALVGAARRLGVKAKAGETSSGYRVALRDAEAIGLLLERMGARGTRLAWEERWACQRRPVKSTGRGCADANRHRSAQAAAVASIRVERALAILGDSAPHELALAGKLRMNHPQASLDELGRLADPPMTKDTVAGRIRRLLALADRKAEHDGVTGTNAAVTTTALDGIAV